MVTGLFNTHITSLSSPPDARQAPPRILVVDDEQHMCDICARVLKRTGYDVTITSDPDVAVRFFREFEHFDLLLTDIKMPTMSGLDLAHIAREHDPAIAIIVMTGFASMEHLHQSVQRGVAEFLTKPFELDQLRLAVDQALHKRTLLQDNLRLQALNHLLISSEKLNSTLNLQQLTQTLLDIAIQQSGCRAGVVLMNNTATDLGVVTAVPSHVEVLDAGYALVNKSFDQQSNMVAEGQLFCRDHEANLTHACVIVLRAQHTVNGVLLLCDNDANTFLPGIQEEIALLANYAGAAFHNATLYSQLEEAYQRLQEVDRLKSEFIAIASHELRTPLSIVLGYTTIVRDQSSAEQYDYLQRVIENAQRIKSVLDGMVSLRLSETGSTQLNLENCQLQEVLEDAIQQQQSMVAEYGHTIDTNFPQEVIHFLCDREKVMIILGHLLSNAIRFTPTAGRISLHAKLCGANELDTVSGSLLTPMPISHGMPWILIAIEDTGIGIPQHEQMRVFDRFYQVGESLTRDQGGTGLGLAIVRELVCSLGGAVWIFSQEGQGSTFSFVLPYRHEVWMDISQEYVV
ncbi:MAG: response regulator [Chloroflexota bacterium]